MSEYVYRPRGSYGRYLQTKSFVDDIRWDISQSALKVSASVDALRDSGARIESAITTGLTQTSRSLRNSSLDTGKKIEHLRENVEKVDQTLRVGFDDLGNRLDQVDDTIRDGFDFVGDRLEQVDDTLRSGFVRLHFDIKEVTLSLKDMSAKFDYGVGLLNTRLGSINDTLDALKIIAQNPERVWAFEQYRIAHDAFDRGLFTESLSFVTRAIDGHQSHTGYMLEHRFHYLLGVIRLGDRSNNLPPIIDPTLAESAFLNAARYARGMYNADAARAMCSAGFSAYVQGKIDVATKYTEQALQLKSDLPQGHFQHAKLRFYERDVRQGLDSLKRAISLDPLYAVKCFNDDDFLQYEPFLTSMIEDMGSRLQQIALETIDRLYSCSISAERSVQECYDNLNLIFPDYFQQKLEMKGLHEELRVFSTIFGDGNGKLPYIDTVTWSKKIDSQVVDLGARIIRAQSNTTAFSNSIEIIGRIELNDPPELVYREPRPLVVYLDRQSKQKNLAVAIVSIVLIVLGVVNSNPGIFVIIEIPIIALVGFIIWLFWPQDDVDKARGMQDSERASIKLETDAEHEMRLEAWKKLNEIASASADVNKMKAREILSVLFNTLERLHFGTSIFQLARERGVIY